ncbi:MAG TPA: ABC transporter permease [Terriglobia bacterium]|nr:ABC transporter permease [Terriglobia bacterium]
MSTLLQDLKYGFRTLVKNPAFTAVAVIALALGIGANTAIFSVVNAVLLKPLPFRDPSRLMLLSEANPRQPRVSVAYPNYFDWKQQNHVFEEMTSFQQRDFNLAGVNEPENIGGSAVSSNLLRTLGMKSLLGRDFRPDEDKKGAESVVILGYSLWQRRFGGEPGVVGRTVTLDAKPFTIVGVMPPQLILYEDSQLYTPIGVWMGEESMTERGAHDDTTVVARLKAGVTQAQAQAEMDTIARRLEQQYPDTNTGYRVAMSPIRDAFVGDSGPPILVLFAAVGFVLLIACVNVANLLLARGAAREREIAIRSALGASRLRVIRQLLTEGAVLAVVSGLLGLLVGAWGLKGLLTLIPQDVGMGMPVAVNSWVLGFTSLLSLATVAIFGLVPALQVSKPDLNETLKEGGRTASGGVERRQLRSVLVVSEIALALVLLVSAGLMIKSFRRLLAVDPGFNPENVLTMEVNLRGAKYDKPDQVAALCQQALDRIRTLPGVKLAALGNQLPLTDSHSRSDITIEGQPVPEIGHFPHPDFHRISPDYFRAMGIPLMRGRYFTESDTPQAPGAVMISESLARQFWPNGDAVGKRILRGHPDPKNPWRTVVGVVGDTKQYGLSAETKWEVYLPYLQNPPSDFRLVVRAASNPEGLTAAIKNEVHGIDKDVPVHDAVTMQRIVSDSVGTRRITMLLLGLFAGLAMVLAAVGIYGVISYSVAQRTHEIGVRMALGAERTSVLWLVVGKGFALAIVGVGVGLAGALALTRFLSSLLFGVRPTDPGILIGVSLILTAVSLLASYIPARRAARVDPMVALRYE